MSARVDGPRVMTWFGIAVCVVTFLVFLAQQADGATPQTATVAAAGSTARPVCGLGTSPSCPRGALSLGVMAPGLTLAAAGDAEPVAASGLGTSPSTPVSWFMTLAPILIALIQAAKASPAAKKFLAQDGLGFTVSLLGGMVLSLLSDRVGGGALSWASVKDGFVLAVLASGGYSVAWKRGLKPLLQKGVTRVLGLPVPGWLA